MNKVMLVDDEVALHAVCQKLLERRGYGFCEAFDGESALKMLEREKPDLLLLDVMLPDVNGFDLCSEIRARGNRLPVIFLSGKTDIVDKTMGFRAGGDDYVTKPFDPAELVLRIEANVRRYQGDIGLAQERDREGYVKVGDLEVFFDERRVLVGERSIALTAKEFEMIAFLAESPGKVFTREEIQERVWGRDVVRDPNNLAMFVRNIRKKIEENPSEPVRLLTVHGVGYKLASAEKNSRCDAFRK